MVLDPAYPAKPLHTGAFLLEDVSARGARVETNDLDAARVRKLVTGEHIMAVSLDEAVGAPVRALTFVRWTTRLDDAAFRLGIEFTEMSEEHRDRLQQYLYGIVGAAGIRLQDSTHGARRVMRVVSPYLVAATAVAVGLLIGFLSTQQGHRSSAAPPLVRVGQAPDGPDSTDVIERRAQW
jgi:hypothetical protein